MVPIVIWLAAVIHLPLSAGFLVICRLSTPERPLLRPRARRAPRPYTHQTLSWKRPVRLWEYTGPSSAILSLRAPRRPSITTLHWRTFCRGDRTIGLLLAGASSNPLFRSARLPVTSSYPAAGTYLGEAGNHCAARIRARNDSAEAGWVPSPNRSASNATANAISTATSRIFFKGGKSGAEESFNAGDGSASARAAASIIASVTRCVPAPSPKSRDAITASPTAGKI